MNSKKRMAVASPSRSDLARKVTEAGRRFREVFAAAGETEQILMLHAPKIIYDYPHERRPQAKIRPWRSVATEYLTEQFGPKFAKRVMATAHLRALLHNDLSFQEKNESLGRRFLPGDR